MSTGDPWIYPQAIGGIVETTTTDSTFNINPSYPTFADLQRRQKELEAAMKQAELEAAIRRAMVPQKPFEETEDFRDYVVWLCGFTERHTPPDQEDWETLREKTKKIAAKFALAAKDRAAAKWHDNRQADLFPPNAAAMSSLGASVSSTMDNTIVRSMAGKNS